MGELPEEHVTGEVVSELGLRGYLKVCEAEEASVLVDGVMEAQLNLWVS